METSHESAYDADLLIGFQLDRLNSHYNNLLEIFAQNQSEDDFILIVRNMQIVGADAHDILEDLEYHDTIDGYDLYKQTALSYSRKICEMAEYLENYIVSGDVSHLMEVQTIMEDIIDLQEILRTSRVTFLKNAGLTDSEAESIAGIPADYDF